MNKAKLKPTEMTMEHDGKSDLFLSTSSYGCLFIDETFLYYEEPLMFSCRTTDGTLYLLNLIEIGDTVREYMIVPVTQERIRDMKSKRIDTRTLFVEQGDQACVLIARDGNKHVESKPIKLTDDNLPRKGSYLNGE